MITLRREKEIKLFKPDVDKHIKNMSNDFSRGYIDAINDFIYVRYGDFQLEAQINHYANKKDNYSKGYISSVKNIQKKRNRSGFDVYGYKIEKGPKRTDIRKEYHSSVKWRLHKDIRDYNESKNNYDHKYSKGYVSARIFLMRNKQSLETQKEVNKRFRSKDAYSRGFAQYISDFSEEQRKIGLNIYGKKRKKWK